MPDKADELPSHKITAVMVGGTIGALPAFLMLDEHSCMDAKKTSLLYISTILGGALGSYVALKAMNYAFKQNHNKNIRSL